LRAQKWLFWGFFLAFAIRTPMFPFHAWVIDAQEQAPAGVSAMLAGVFVQMGMYGFLRFSLPMFPEASMRYRTPMIWLSLIAIVYCSLICLMEKNLKRLIAYFSVAYLGFCTLGIFASTPLGLKGSLIQQLNHGISFGALLLIAGMLYARRKTARISDFGGLAKPIPNLAGAFFIFILSVIGIPLLNGFVGEFAILRGAFDVRWQWPAWAAIGLILGAAAMIWLYQRVMLGRTTNYLNENLPDLRWHEYATLTPLLALAFWIGIYPAPIFRILNQPVREIVERYNLAYYAPQNAIDTQSPHPLAQGATASAKNVNADPVRGNN
jgi:NADH-quinone oxidoreductase subunit M